MRKLFRYFLPGLFIFFLVPSRAWGVELPNPIACDSLPCIFVNVMRLFLGALGIFAIFIFMWGGFQMLTSGGNPEQVKKSKDTLVWAALGMAVIIASWAIINYFLGIFTKVTQ